MRRTSIEQAELTCSYKMSPGASRFRTFNHHRNLWQGEHRPWWESKLILRERLAGGLWNNVQCFPSTLSISATGGHNHAPVQTKTLKGRCTLFVGPLGKKNVGFNPYGVQWSTQKPLTDEQKEHGQTELSWTGMIFQSINPQSANRNLVVRSNSWKIL